MTDYISREEVLKAIQPRYAPAINKVLAGIIESVPEADVKPVVRGKWIPHNEIVDPKHKCVSYGFGYGQCSVCKETVWLAKTKTGEMRYCPNCGAEMHTESEEKIG